MPFLKDELRGLIAAILKEEFGEAEMLVVVEYPTVAEHGDYSTPVALGLAKKKGRKAREVAEKIAGAIEKKKPDWVEKVEIAGPGFINFFIAPAFLTEFLEEVMKAGEAYGRSEGKKGRTVVTDTSHPNVAKPMGVHHLLSTIIGNSINRLLVAVGYTVIRDNYLGDWGTQFGKLIYAYKTWGDEKVVKKDPIPELLKLYVKFHEEEEKEKHEEASAQREREAKRGSGSASPSEGRAYTLSDFGRAEFKKFEDGDEENRKLWQWVVDLSLAEFHKLWKRLDVSFDYIHGESFYEDKMQEIIEMGIKKGVFVEGERGALIAQFPHEKYPPAVIRKSDGATLYATRDLARAKYCETTWHPDSMIYVVDMAQSMYFQQLFEVTSMMGLSHATHIHVSFGRMSFPEKKMSTRKGNIIVMEEVLDEAEERAYAIVQEKNPELPEAGKREVARQVGLGAVKFAVLSQNRNTDITFTWDKMLSLEGMSAPYLQYAHARACAILRKVKGKDIAVNAPYVLKEKEELALARLLPRFPEVVALAADELRPNLLANYLFELAGSFNSFYATVPVLSAHDAMVMRLDLVKSVAVTLKNGLKLLGIEAPEEM